MAEVTQAEGRLGLRQAQVRAKLLPSGVLGIRCRWSPVGTQEKML
jgi:hypothetical protein